MNVLTVQAFPWTLAYFNGLEAAAQLQAVTNVLGATHPVLFSMSNLIIFAVARARANHGLGAAWRTGSVYSAPAGLLLVPYFTVLLLWPSAVLELFYGANSPYAGLEAMLRIFVVVYSFRYVMYALSAVLRGLEAGRAVFLGELAGAVAALVLGLPLASRGALAAAGGVAISAATQSIATAYLLRRAL
jgi:O-antigen/teichoic acid export membrane protein